MDETSSDQLNSARIRQMAALRRGAIRSRSYCVIALVGCLVGAAEFIFDGIRRWPVPVNVRGFLIAVAYFLCAAGLIFLGGYCWRLSLRFHREAKQSSLAPPEHPPDFSKLQDGSQFARNLEDIQ